MYMESRKMVLKNFFTGQQWRNRHREQTYGHGERGGEVEMYGKSNMETYITIRKIDSQRGRGGGRGKSDHQDSNYKLTFACGIERAFEN